MHEKVVHRARHGAIGKEATEVTAILGKARNADGLIDRPALGSSQKTGGRQ
jgi:hypothetical protein